MPKEIIFDHASIFDVELHWDRDAYVQIGIKLHPTSSDQPGSIAKLVDVWRLDGDEAEKYDSLWSTLDRDGINRLIRALRRARDQAFGADA